MRNSMSNYLYNKRRTIVGLFTTIVLLFVCSVDLFYQYQEEIFIQAGETLEEDNIENETLETEDADVIDPTQKMVALTFDDGPGPETERLLDYLEEYDARATFFVLGSNVNRYPETIKRMEEMGCEIGNHTFHHKNLTTLNVLDMQDQIQWTNNVLTNTIGHGAETVRPTYGELNADVIANVPYPFLMWSVDSTDWQRKDAESIAYYVLQTVEDGDVVLLHDIHGFTVDASLEIISTLKEWGYQIVTMSEMAQARGVTFEPGIKYYKFPQ